jgi:hypothetical protein
MVELDEEDGGDGYPVGVLSTVRRCPSRESLRSVTIVEESAQRKRTAHLKPAVTPTTRLAAMATISTSPSNRSLDEPFVPRKVQEGIPMD